MTSMRRNTNHQETGPLFPISICEPCLRYRHHPLWPKQDRKRFRYEKHSWQVIKRQLIFVFPLLLFLMQDKILARVKYWKLEVPPVEKRPTHDQLYFD